MMKPAVVLPKRKLAEQLYQEVLSIWETDQLLETQKAKYIWLFKLMNAYEYEDVIGCAKWLKTQMYPTAIAQVYTSMGKYLEWRAAEEKKKSWQYV